METTEAIKQGPQKYLNSELPENLKALYLEMIEIIDGQVKRVVDAYKAKKGTPSSEASQFSKRSAVFEAHLSAKGIHANDYILGRKLFSSSRSDAVGAERIEKPLEFDTPEHDFEHFIRGKFIEEYEY